LEALDEATKILSQAETIYLIGFAILPDLLLFELRPRDARVRTVLAGSPTGWIAKFCRSPVRGTRRWPSVSRLTRPPRRIHATDRRQKTPLVAITDSPFSPLVFNASVWFEVVENDFEGFRSLAATMTLASALAVAVASVARSRETEFAFRLK